ncbi:TPA: major capsid protein [Campylobacter jejuni]|nr:major capsid protein [Campylobacter jejuni]HDV7513977.1 major capsid protein [Campylobacter jejuni]HDV7520729.1 major capsid protein [Campylobacter jejuni]
MDLEQLLEIFSSTKVTEAINQVKASPRFVSDTFFKDRIPSLESTARVEIIKGAGIVLNSVSENGEHSLEETRNAYILNIPLPRFALVKRISASEINSLRSLALREAQIKSLSGAMGVLIKEMKESFNTTLEYMANGALFGKILDGQGNTLFDFGSTNKSIVEVKKDGSKTLANINDNIESKIIDEFGTSINYEVLCGNELFASISDLALKEDLYKNHLASRDEKDKSLILYGTKYRRYSAKYKNTKGKSVEFLASNEGIVVPNDNSNRIYYTRANHTEALGKEPTLMFVSKPEILQRGAGIEIVGEMRALPVCTRPNGLIKLTLS